MTDLYSASQRLEISLDDSQGLTSPSTALLKLLFGRRFCALTTKASRHTLLHSWLPYVGKKALSFKDVGRYRTPFWKKFYMMLMENTANEIQVISHSYSTSYKSLLRHLSQDAFQLFLTRRYYRLSSWSAGTETLQCDSIKRPLLVADFTLEW